jgi:hypothetical protein
MKLGSLACAAIALLASGAGGTANRRHIVETAPAGNVHARFSYDYGDFGSYVGHGNQRLTVRRHGFLVLNARLRPHWHGDGMWPGFHQRHVFVQDLDGDHEPEVFLDLLQGGAHGGEYSVIYRYVRSRRTYRFRTHIWWDPGYRLRDLHHGGLPEFVSGDHRFMGQFTDEADSSWPAQIWRYRDGWLFDVTRRFPETVRRDALREWRWASSSRYRRENAGILAAWAGDECLVGRCASALSRLDAFRRSGRIRVIGDTPKHYLLHLRRFLRQTGCLR